MNDTKLVLEYSLRLLRREWRHFVLPFLSLLITTVVLSLILLLTNSGSLLLKEQARNLKGGDVVLESNTPIDADEFWQTAGVIPELQSEQLTFTATILSNEVPLSASLLVVDENYPLYGTMELEAGQYKLPAADEMLLDQSGAERLGVTVGDQISFGEQTYTLTNIIISEPTSLANGFRFLPRVLLSQAGFALANIDSSFLRAEYLYAAKIPDLSTSNIESLRRTEEIYGRSVDVDLANNSSGGLLFGLRLVTDFLVVAVLITAILAAVNVYSSTLYLITTERKSLAIFLALGLRKNLLVAILGSTLAYTVLLAGIIGTLIGFFAFLGLNQYIATEFLINLPIPAVAQNAFICLTLISTIAIASFVPAVRKTFALNPKQILIGGETDNQSQQQFTSLFVITLSTLFPLVILATYLLDSLKEGVSSIGIIVVIYVLTAALFALLLNWLYQNRSKFGTAVSHIISQKKADGLFGIISFTSLLIALTALSTLSLLQTSLKNYLTGDLNQNVPTAYVLDVQPSQKAELENNFPELQLFSNTGARILQIDNILIQDEIAADNPNVDRELGREFNLTDRNELLSSEVISSGVWHEGRAGEISVDEELAKRANIKLGSKLVFLIQGFTVSGTVTSLRQTDSRSGLPFFYFVLSPEDIDKFPNIYFGYAYLDEVTQSNLGQFLAREMPNVTIFETKTLGPALISLINTLMILILIVTLPPLLIATLLIATLVVSAYGARRRDGARLRALGATRQSVLFHYLAETISLTLFASIFSYVVSIVLVILINQFFLELETVILFNLELIIGLSLIVTLVGVIGLFLFKTDTMPLRALLSYESND
ncbi:MAG TPA: hypothetical protein PKA42_02125 [Candidatus Paceibacterota bacterium]|nr:hypothetical protein [Candidatus Paceibacterota bacterium]